MADDAVILEQAFDVALAETRDPVEIEAMERGAEIPALGKDGAPAESGLETLQVQFLEQATIVGDREAPFGVVIAKEFRRRRAPAAARPAVPDPRSLRSFRRPQFRAIRSGEQKSQPFVDS